MTNEEIINDIIRCRGLARESTGADYTKVIMTYFFIIDGIMQDKKIGALDAAVSIIRDMLRDRIENVGAQTIFLCAAIAEIHSPDPLTPLEITTKTGNVFFSEN